MGSLSDAVRGLQAAVPIPGGRGRYFLGWGGNYVPAGGSPFRLPGERDYQSVVGDGGGTALISAAVNWTAREVVPARRVLLKSSAADDGVPTVVRRHPLLDLLRRPNPFYSGTAMLQAIKASRIVDGNAYIWKIRSGVDRLVQLWYLPHWCVDPIGSPDGSVFIEHYRYTVAGRTIEIEPEDMWHLRFGLDPDNPRKGMSPVRGVLREVFTDEEAARFSAALLHNVGYPGAVVIPGQNVVVSDRGAREEIRDTFDARFGGEGRGRTIVLGANAEVKFLQWSPKDLDLSSLRDVPEERVSAVLGIPAAVLGFGTGLQQVKVGATMRELRAMAWEGALIPGLDEVAETDTLSLLPEFMDEPELERHEMSFDLSRIAALSEMHLRRATLEATLVRARIKRVDESRTALGLPAVGGKDGGFQASPGVGGSNDEGAPSSGGDGGEEEEADEEEEGAEGAPPALSARQSEILGHVRAGMLNKEIAGALGVSLRTVEREVTSLIRRFGVTDRSGLSTVTA